MARAARNDEPLGFEDTLWKAADKLRGSMDASEYKRPLAHTQIRAAGGYNSSSSLA
jgi:hypothetical protein